jgi:hypothetical protein
VNPVPSRKTGSGDGHDNDGNVDGAFSGKHASRYWIFSRANGIQLKEFLSGLAII